MKNILLALVLGITIYSCSDKDETSDAFDLTGTSWIYQITTTEQSVYEKIKFLDSNKFSDSAVYNGSINANIKIYGTYSYSNSNISLIMNGVTQKGTIQGRNMNITTTYGNTVTYIKQ